MLLMRILPSSFFLFPWPPPVFWYLRAYMWLDYHPGCLKAPEDFRRGFNLSPRAPATNANAEDPPEDSPRPRAEILPSCLSSRSNLRSVANAIQFRGEKARRNRPNRRMELEISPDAALIANGGSCSVTHGNRFRIFLHRAPLLITRRFLESFEYAIRRIFLAGSACRNFVPWMIELSTLAITIITLTMWHVLTRKIKTI